MEKEMSAEQQFSSRYDDTRLVKCEECGWVGQVKDCLHIYREIVGTGGDVEPLDECPSCESEELWEVEQQ